MLIATNHVVLQGLTEVKHLGRLSQLESLNVSVSCPLLSPLLCPPAFHPLALLLLLLLQFNALTVAHELHSLSALVYLNISHNRVESVRLPPTLTSLNISHNCVKELSFLASYALHPRGRGVLGLVSHVHARHCVALAVRPV